MKVIFENLYNVTEESINAPFIVDDVPMGIITEVNKKTFSILIWDRFIGAEKHWVDGSDSGHPHKEDVFDDVFGGNIRECVTAIYLKKNHS